MMENLTAMQCPHGVAIDTPDDSVFVPVDGVLVEFAQEGIASVFFYLSKDAIEWFFVLRILSEDIRLPV